VRAQLRKHKPLATRGEMEPVGEQGLPALRHGQRKYPQTWHARSERARGHAPAHAHAWGLAALPALWRHKRGSTAPAGLCLAGGGKSHGREPTASSCMPLQRSMTGAFALRAVVAAAAAYICARSLVRSRTPVALLPYFSTWYSRRRFPSTGGQVRTMTRWKHSCSQSSTAAMLAENSCSGTCCGIPAIAASLAPKHTVTRSPLGCDFGNSIGSSATAWRVLYPVCVGRVHPRTGQAHTPGHPLQCH